MRQMGSNSRALLFSSLLLLGFAAVPGFPAPLFLLLSGTLAFTAYRIAKKSAHTKVEAGEPVGAFQRAGAKGEAPAILARAPQFTSAIGIKLSIDLAKKLSPAALDKAFEAQRAKLQEELGLPFPGITMWSSNELATATYEILVHDVPSAKFTLPAGQVMLPGAGTDSALAAQCEPASAAGGFAQSHWIDEKNVPQDAIAWQAADVIANETISILRSRAQLFLGIQETQWVLDQLGGDFPGLIAEVQKALPLQRIADVLRRLLEEGISIRNTRSIMESLIVWGPKEKDMLMLTEYVRGDLSRYIAYRATGGSRQMQAVLLDGEVEQHIRQSIKQTPTGNFLALPPHEIKHLIDSVLSFVGDQPRSGVGLVASMDVRRYVRRMIESRIGWLQVYSYQELGEHVELQSLGRVTL